ncbi:isoprenyl transferase [Sporolactobacillus terrae]|uniref:Isoprenyl transferase n=1 Tax=Sporolactobacillus terrae TaxID=269673 RepID=A0ABX5Q6W0_9BACL|nr:isoprenyl transferase [Sporolactobacillus terrae]QAA22371.1 isoprenyl transferase [Sporolactobacillus terrae]QAA25347.1 isoprenyl transferase [Sporolactobacillus terrae]UAK17156.1 isoprenyl transferase [Sporolactobacillus terrae]
MFEKFSLNKGKTAMPKHEDTKSISIPNHVAIIMDGNGRWAKKRGLPRVAGHREAMKTIKRVTKEADRLGVKVLTLYAFSTENWKRPKAEVDFLMKLPQQFLNSYLKELIEQNVQVKAMGDLSRLPTYTLSAVNDAIEKTKANSGLILNFALNYGSHAEIVQAVKKIIREAHSPEDISEKMIADHMISPALPDPDLLIRTGGEIRLSNFMLWQLAYTELYFSEEYWPDFNEQSLQDAVRAFSSRQRRFGGLAEGSENP